MTTTRTAATRSILVHRRGEEDVIVEGVPANAKITFGPVNPGKPGYHGDNMNALRIYTSANNQLAVFLNVTSFRDLSLTVKERQVTRKVRSDAKRGPDGRVSEDSYEETYEWVEAQQ